MVISFKVMLYGSIRLGYVYIQPYLIRGSEKSTFLGAKGPPYLCRYKAVADRVH
jgi:hypothetical protein